MKPVTCFYARSGSFGSYQSYCVECSAHRHRGYYASNKEYYVAKRQRLREKHRHEIQRLKDKPCADCGGRFPYYVMDFDHLPGFEKKEGVANMRHRTASWKAVLEEIAKCELVCSNCHRARTWQRKYGNKS